MKPENANELLGQPNIDGALVAERASRSISSWASWQGHEPRSPRILDWNELEWLWNIKESLCSSFSVKFFFPYRP